MSDLRDRPGTDSGTSIDRYNRGVTIEPSIESIMAQAASGGYTPDAEARGVPIQNVEQELPEVDKEPFNLQNYIMEEAMRKETTPLFTSQEEVDQSDRFTEFVSNPFIQNKILNSGNPEEELAKAFNIFALSEELNLSQETVYRNYSTIGDTYFGEGGTEISRKEKRKLFWKAGQMNYEQGLLAYKEMTQGLNDEERQRYEDITAMMPQFNIDRKDIPEVFQHALLSNLPMMIESGLEGMEESLATGLGTAAVGAVGGSAVPVLGTGVGAAGGFSTGFAVAKTFYTTDAIKRMTAGHTYMKLKAMEGVNGEKISDDVIRNVSEISGALSAVAEVAGLAALFTGIPGLKNIVSGAIKNGPKIITDTMLGQWGMKFMGHLTGAAISENVEEYTQFGIEMAAENVAIALSDNPDVFKYTRTTPEEVVDELKATWLPTTLLAPFLALGPAAFQAGSNQAKLMEDVNQAAREAVALAGDEGASVEKAMQIFKDDPRVSILSDKKLLKVMGTTEERATFYNSLSKDPENIDVNLSELYEDEVDAEYVKYVEGIEEGKTPKTKEQFEQGYLSAQGRSVPVRDFSTEQIGWMYSNRQREYREAVAKGMDPDPLPTIAKYQEQFADASEIYSVLNKKSKTAETLSRMQEAKDSLQQMSEEVPGQIPGVIEDALRVMQSNIDSAREAAGQLVANAEGEAVIYKGPEAYTTKDIELINNRKIQEIQRQIKEIEEAKKSSEVSPVMEMQANERMLELEERIINLEREKKDIDYFLRQQFYNQRKAAEYLDKAKERSGRINKILAKKNDPEFIKDLSDAGADAVYDEIVELESSDLGAKDVPLDIVALLGLDEEQLNEAVKTRNAFKFVWRRAFEMANIEKKLDMALGQQMKAYQSQQARRVDSLLAQIKKPLGKISPRRQDQIRTAQALVGLKTSEEINYSRITEEIKKIMDSETKRIAKSHQGYFVSIMNRVLRDAEDLRLLEGEMPEGVNAIFNNPEEMPSSKRAWNWKVMVRDAVATAATMDVDTESSNMAAVETLAALDELDLTNAEDDIVWNNIIDTTVKIAETALENATVTDYTKEAFKDQIDAVMAEYEVTEGKEKTLRSVETLEATKALVDFLRYAGKVEVEQMRTEVDVKSSLASSLINNTVGYTQEGIKAGIDPNESSNFKKNRHAAAGTFKHPGAFFRELGGEALQEMYVTESRYLANKKEIEIKRRSEAIHKKMADYGIKLKDFQETVELGGRQVPLQERMGIYLATKDKRTFDSLVDTNVITREIGNNITDNLTENEMKLADAIGEDFLEAWERMSPVYMATKKKALGRILNYLPIMRKYIETDDIETSLLDNMLFGDKTYDSNIYDKFGETRQLEGLDEKAIEEKINEAQEIRVDLFDMWSDTVHKQEHYIASAEQVAIMDNGLGGSAQRSIEKKYGSKVYRQAKDYVKHYANPAMIHGSTWLDKAARTLRGNVTFGHLAASPSIVWRQGLSGPLYMMYVSPGEYFGSMAQFWAHPINSMKWMKENMPYIIKSGVGFDLINTRVENAKGAAAVKRKIQDAGMFGITLADQVTKAIGAKAVYNQDVGLYGHDQAVKNAIKVTDITQPTSDRTALPDAYRHGAIFDWALMYQQQPLKILNLMTYEMKNKAMDIKYDSDAIGNMIYGSIAIMTSMAGIWILKNRKLPETPGDIAEIMLLGVVGDIPVIGREMINGATGRYSGPSAAFDFARAIGKLASDAPAKDKLDAAFFDIGPAFTGVNPGNSVQNVLDYMDTGAIGEVLVGGQWGE